MPAKRPIAPAPDDLVTLADVAEMLHKSPSAIYVMRWRAAKGEGSAPPAYRIGNRLLFSRSEVLRWVATQRDDFDAATAKSA